MNITEQTEQQLQRFFKKISQKFPSSDAPSLVTDIHVFISPESGEMIAYDDDGQEITRCVVEQWINCTDENFYPEASNQLQHTCEAMRSTLEELGILKPYSIVLEDDENTTVAELFLADDDTVIIGQDLMHNLNSELDDFLASILHEGEEEMRGMHIS